MKSQRSMLGASCPVSRWHYSYCWQMQRKQDVARGQEQPGSPWMQRNPALKQHSFVGKVLPFPGECGGQLPTIAISVAACAFSFTLLDILLLNTVSPRTFWL